MVSKAISFILGALAMLIFLAWWQGHLEDEEHNDGNV